MTHFVNNYIKVRKAYYIIPIIVAYVGITLGN